MHACIHAFIHACKHTCMHTYTSMHIHACLHAGTQACRTYIHICVHACTYTDVQTDIHICIDTWTHTHKHIYVGANIRMYSHMDTYAHIHTLCTCSHACRHAQTHACIQYIRICMHAHIILIFFLLRNVLYHWVPKQLQSQNNCSSQSCLHKSRAVRITI
jgi:hypothetical protein